MGGYAWAHDLIANALRPLGQPGNGTTDGAQRTIVVRGWEQVQVLLCFGSLAGDRFHPIILTPDVWQGTRK